MGNQGDQGPEANHLCGGTDTMEELSISFIFGIWKNEYLILINRYL